MNMLIGFRFLAGCVGVTAVNNGGGTIADLMPTEKRGGGYGYMGHGTAFG